LHYAQGALQASQGTLEDLHLTNAPHPAAGRKWTPDLTHFSMLRSLSLCAWMPPDDYGLLSCLPTSLHSLKITTSRACAPADRWAKSAFIEEADVSTILRLLFPAHIPRRRSVSHLPGAMAARACMSTICLKALANIHPG